MISFHSLFVPSLILLQVFRQFSTSFTGLPKVYRRLAPGFSSMVYPSDRSGTFFINYVGKHGTGQKTHEKGKTRGDKHLSYCFRTITFQFSRFSVCFPRLLLLGSALSTPYRSAKDREDFPESIQGSFIVQLEAGYLPRANQDVWSMTVLQSHKQSILESISLL